MEKNIFIEKLKDKSTDELLELLKSDEHVLEAKLAAKTILEERGSIPKSSNTELETNSDEEKVSEDKEEQSKEFLKGYTGKKLYTERQVSASAFFGGPLPAGILIYKNLIRLGKEKEAYITLASTLILSIGMVFFLINGPAEIVDKIPDQLFPPILGILVWVIYHKLFARLAKNVLKEKGLVSSNWNVAGITLFGTVLFVVFAMIIGMNSPTFPGTLKEYKGGNEIYYGENSNVKDADKLSSQLFTIEYFNPQYPGSARLETHANSYTVTLLFNQDYWEDQELINSLISLKWLLETDYSSSVDLKLMDYNLRGEEIYKTIEDD